MLKALLSRIPFLRPRTSFGRDDQLKADAAARQEGWKRVIADHQKPLGPQSPQPSGKDA
jgi:hypothetical protein